MMSTASNFEIDSPANISEDSSKIHCKIVNNVLNESSTLSRELIGNRFLHLTRYSDANLMQPIQTKTNLELMEELGLLGAISDREVTSETRKEFIRKSIRKRHEKESNC